MTKNRFSSRNLLSLLIVSLLSVFVAACGSSNSGDFGRNDYNFGHPYAGRYLGASAAPDNYTAGLSLLVDGGGNANGELTVKPLINSQTVQPVSYPVNGAVNANNGNFTVSGTAAGYGPFTIQGNLPTGTGLATYLLRINGQNFNGNIQAASQGTPSIPGSGNPDDGKAIFGGTVSALTFTPSGNYNGVNPPVSASSAISGAVGPGIDGSENAIIVLSETFSEAGLIALRTLVVGIALPVGEELRVGNTYQLVNDSTGKGSYITLTKSVGNIVKEGWSHTPDTTGYARITSMNNDNITMEFQFTNVGPNSEIVNNPARGTFAISGTITGNFVNQP